MVNENSVLSPMIPTKNKIIMLLNNIFLVKLNGKHNLYKRIKPVYPVKITHNVDVSLGLILNIYDANITTNILVTIVKAVGIALLITFSKKFPFTIALFRSNANTNDGIPIVTILVNVSCIG